MQNTLSRQIMVGICISASLLLNACGSGNNTSLADTTPAGVALVPGTDIPINATVDSQAALDFVSSVVAKGEANTEDPLVLGDATLATSDISDPVTIIAA